jgi:hypothetical protein
VSGDGSNLSRSWSDGNSVVVDVVRSSSMVGVFIGRSFLVGSLFVVILGRSVVGSVASVVDSNGGSLVIVIVSILISFGFSILVFGVFVVLGNLSSF